MKFAGQVPAAAQLAAQPVEKPAQRDPERTREEIKPHNLARLLCIPVYLATYSRELPEAELKEIGNCMRLHSVVRHHLLPVRSERFVIFKLIRMARSNCRKSVRGENFRSTALSSLAVSVASSKSGRKSEI